MANACRFADEILLPVKLLFLSTPVGPLGSGLGGGVELTLKNIAIALQERGHHVQVLAPEGSQLSGVPLTTVSGALQVLAQTQTREAPICLPANSVLANLWGYARQVQCQYDLRCSAMRMPESLRRRLLASRVDERP